MYIVFHFVLLRKITFIPLHCVAQTPVIRGIGESLLGIIMPFVQQNGEQ